MIKNLFLALALYFNSSLSWGYLPKEGNIQLQLFALINQSLLKNHSYSAPILTGAGLQVLGDLNSRSSLEISLSNYQKVYSNTENSIDYIEKTDQFHILIGYQYWMTPFLTFSLGLNSSYSFNDPHQINYTQKDQYYTSAQDITEYEIESGLNFNLLETRFGTLVSSLRYNKSISHRENENADHVIYSLGLRQLVLKK